MSKAQRIIVRGTASNATARRLISSVLQPAKHVLEATVEFLNEERDIICRKARYGTFFFVRSVRFSTRYYVVTWNKERSAWQCTCPQQCANHEHIERVNTYIKVNTRSEVA